MKTNEKPIFKIIVDFDHNLRLESTGKHYVVFKSFHIVNEETNEKTNIQSVDWLFGEWFENNDYDVEITGEFKTFDSLQKCFNYAEERGFLFI